MRSVADGADACLGFRVGQGRVCVENSAADREIFGKPGATEREAKFGHRNFHRRFRLATNRRTQAPAYGRPGNPDKHQLLTTADGHSTSSAEPASLTSMVDQHPLQKWCHSSRPVTERAEPGDPGQVDRRALCAAVCGEPEPTADAATTKLSARPPPRTGPPEIFAVRRGNLRSALAPRPARDLPARLAHNHQHINLPGISRLGPPQPPTYHINKKESGC